VMRSCIAGVSQGRDKDQQRITLVVVFWAAKMKPKAGVAGSGPMQALPSAEELQSSCGQTWAEDFHFCDSTSSHADRCVAACKPTK
jgi:hypothetical protein